MPGANRGGHSAWARARRSRPQNPGSLTLAWGAAPRSGAFPEASVARERKWVPVKVMEGATKHLKVKFAHGFECTLLRDKRWDREIHFHYKSLLRKKEGNNKKKLKVEQLNQAAVLSC